MIVNVLPFCTAVLDLKRLATSKTNHRPQMELIQAKAVTNAGHTRKTTVYDGAPPAKGLSYGAL